MALCVATQNVWQHAADLIPGRIVCVDPGGNEPEMCIAEEYMPRFRPRTGHVKFKDS